MQASKHTFLVNSLYFSKVCQTWHLVYHNEVDCQITKLPVNYRVRIEAWSSTLTDNNVIDLGKVDTYIDTNTGLITAYHSVFQPWDWEMPDEAKPWTPIQ